uniref:Uncharacterized protein LOC114342319 n=1 Tax=Diabrotica virgifera virgifera TaxID=50390 RepID=A0A6P7GU59_DIAVI
MIKEVGVFSNNSNTATDTLVDTFAFYNLFQLNHITNCNGVLLDLVFANDNENVTVEIANDYLLPCDRYHPAISISLAIKDNMPELQYDSFAFNFRRGDYVALNMYLASISWENVLGICSDINEATELFYSILQFGIHCSIPRVRLKNPKFPRWMTNDLKSLIFRKKVAHKIYKQANFWDDYLLFSSLRTKCKELSRSCHDIYISQTESRISSNVKHFWKFVNSRRKNNGLPNTMFLGNTVLNNGADIVNNFA